MNFLDADVEVKGKDVFLHIGDDVLKMPEDKAKILKDGGYDGKTVVLGIRPEDVHDEPAFIQANPNSTISAPVRVYELLGAEVFLYFDFAGAQMTARVNPRTTARAGDTVTFALDMDKTHYFDKETQKTITD
jgi:multiple sugar transport system ATP-binding protein